MALDRWEPPNPPPNICRSADMRIAAVPASPHFVSNGGATVSRLSWIPRQRRLALTVLVAAASLVAGAAAAPDASAAANSARRASSAGHRSLPGDLARAKLVAANAQAVTAAQMTGSGLSVDADRALSVRQSGCHDA